MWCQVAEADSLQSTRHWKPFLFISPQPYLQPYVWHNITQKIIFPGCKYNWSILSQNTVQAITSYFQSRCSTAHQKPVSKGAWWTENGLREGWWSYRTKKNVNIAATSDARVGLVPAAISILSECPWQEHWYLHRLWLSQQTQERRSAPGVITNCAHRSVFWSSGGRTKPAEVTAHLFSLNKLYEIRWDGKCCETLNINFQSQCYICKPSIRRPHLLLVGKGVWLLSSCHFQQQKSVLR